MQALNNPLLQICGDVEQGQDTQVQAARVAPAANRNDVMCACTQVLCPPPREARIALAIGTVVTLILLGVTLAEKYA
jgi:hypothetical protein